MAALWIQADRTPPPSPPRAAIKRLMGRAAVKRSLRRRERRRVCAPAAQPADQRPRQAMAQAIPPRWILHHVDLRKGRAKLRRVRNLAAQAAAHAVVID